MPESTDETILRRLPQEEQDRIEAIAKELGRDPQAVANELRKRGPAATQGNWQRLADQLKAEAGILREGAQSRDTPR